MRDRADVAIIGGGISGLALAFELAKRRPSMRIVVLERRYTGAGASSRNVGRVRAMQLTPTLIDLALAAQRKHARLSDELRSNTLFWRSGYAWVFYEDAELERMASLLPVFRAHGLRRPRLLTHPREVARAIPVLAGGQPAAGAVIGRDAIGHHDAVLYAYRRACAGLGVELREGTEVTGIVRDGSAVVGVRVGGSLLATDTVVNATDGWSREVSAWAGVPTANTPVRREVFVTEPSQPFMRPAITFYRPVEGWFNQTLRGELVAGVTAANEPEGLEHESSYDFLRRTSATLMVKAPRLGHLRIIRQWAGVYDMTPDRLPLVGHVRARPGFVQMNGYSGRGFALAPVLAEDLARWLLTGERPDRLAALDPDRSFGTQFDAEGGADYYSAYGPARGPTSIPPRRGDPPGSTVI